MSKLGGLFTRKSSVFDQLAQPSPTAVTATEPPANPLEIDEELFSALGAQVGADNETLRNLLLDANAKISELDAIKAAVGKLADPVSKTLLAYEAEKSEKINLQTVLNSTRTAYGKLRSEASDMEKKLARLEKDNEALRQNLAWTQSQLHTVEATKAEIDVDIAARRAQIADLESRLTQETGECNALREENHRLDERLTSINKRVIVLESDINAARQRLLMAEDEKRVQQASLDKACTDAARIARKLAETEASLNATQGRLRSVEANYAELSTERARLVTALDEANERHNHEITTQRMRFEALQARANSTDNLLSEAREHLLARAEDVRDFDRRLSAAINERDGLHTRVTELEADRIRRESEFRELEQTRATLMERGGALTRAYTAKESALARAEDSIVALNARLETLAKEKADEKLLADQKNEELNAALQREKMERSVAEGALESARKDFARVMRDVMNLQRLQQAGEDPAELKAANAA
jgi:crescentin